MLYDCIMVLLLLSYKSPSITKCGLMSHNYAHERFIANAFNFIIEEVKKELI